MRSFLAESGVEEVCLNYLAELRWQVLYGPDLAPSETAAERTSFRDGLLDGRLRDAIERLNPDLESGSVRQVIATLRRPESADVLAENARIYSLLTNGVPIERRDLNGQTRHDLARLIDFENPDINDFVAVNQFTVQGERSTRRPDVLAFVNGIPLGVIELKVPGEVRATLHGAYEQLRTYAADIPALMVYSGVNVISTGTEARSGALGGVYEHYAPWKTIDGYHEAPEGTPELEVLIRGVFEPGRFLDMVRNFTVFSGERSGLVKRIAKYQQFRAVNRAVAATLRAMERADGRGGVIWHAPGSGKSFQMLFFVNKILRHPAMANPTAVLLTDRDSLDDQLFEEVFSHARTLLERPEQASSRDHLRKLLAQKASGGIVFSTMQKFGRSNEDRAAGTHFPLLSDRSNIVVIADEAHRTQYDLIDGLARNLRDALPNAVFIGFTGTPIEKADRNTRDVFGDYIDIYDMTQSIEDEATVKVYYEPRLAKVELPEEVRATIDDEFATVTERAEVDSRDRLKSRWARVEAVVGAKDRLREVAADIVDHWEQRLSREPGKALIVGMSRRICVDLYDAIVALRPEWHSDDDAKGKIKVVITGAATEGPELNRHVRNRDRLSVIEGRAKDPDDPLEIVIVRDMWLAGFDSPPMHTMYVDKPMQGAGLMQAISRVNRSFREKGGGLVVDYIGIAESLRAALQDYTERDRDRNDVGDTLDRALDALQEHWELCCSFLYGFPWREELASGSPQAFLEAIAGATRFLLSGDLDLPDLFIKHARMANQAFTLAVSLADSKRYRDDLAFFQAVATDLRRQRATERGEISDDGEFETALRQMVSKAVVGTGIVDIYAEIGLAKPDISLIDEEFAARAQRSPQPNVQIEMLRRLLKEEVKAVAKRNVVMEHKFSELLDRATKAYTNRSLTAAQVIAQLVEMAQEMKHERDRGNLVGLPDDELAFYDAVSQNGSALLILGDDTLKQIAHDLVRLIRTNTTVDWNIKEQARAKLRSTVRRLLTKYHYPPDKKSAAVDLVLEQAERLAAEVTA
ncbi:MAG: type I restriction endonuclease subunit R [Candidatus Dormibacteria bacterium]